MEYLPSYKEDLYLTHHGIKGQKWGVRRYQNKDGSLTSRGRIRRNEAIGSSKKSIFNDPKTRKIIDKAIPIVGTSLAIGGTAALIYGSSRSNIEQSPYYDPSTGLLRSKKAHSSVADCAAVNMGRAYTIWPGYINNCGLCSAAYDMRRRGYNVHAGQSYTGIPVSSYSSWYPGCKYESIAQTRPKTVREALNPIKRIRDVHGSLSQATRQMEAHGPNARGVMLVQWATGGGHAVAWENDSRGRAHIVESQLGVKYRNPVAKALEFSCLNLLNPYSSANSIVRLDNVEPDIDAMLSQKVIVNNPTMPRFNRSASHTTIGVNSLDEAIDILAEYYPRMIPTSVFQRFDHYFIIELAPEGYNANQDGMLIDSLYFVDMNNGNCGPWVIALHDDYAIDKITLLDEDGSPKNSTLTHYGIKGQKWGIRRYQNSDGSYTSVGRARRNVNSKNDYARNVAIGIGVASATLAIYGGIYLHNANNEYGSASIIAGPLKDNLDDFGTSRSDVRLPKGTKFQRISTEANEDYIQRGHTYVSNTLHDNLVYRNKMPAVLGQDRPYIHTLKANSEVRAPSRRVAAETYLTMRPNATHAEYKNFMAYGIREDTDRQREFINRLNQSGYNAVIDENDAGGHGITRQPLILLHPDVTTTGTHRMSRVEKVLASI